METIRSANSQALVQEFGSPCTSYLLQECVLLYLVLLAVRPG